MADSFRQDPSDKVKAALTPDAQKPWTEQKSDQAASKADKVASHLQPDGSKSTTQKAIDTLAPGNDSHVGEGARQSPTDALKAKLKPDAQKSETEIQKDHAKGTADNIASHVEPEGHKSLGQKIIDFVTPHHSSEASDNYRQSTSDKIGSALKPDAQKTEAEIQKDHLKGTADNAAGDAIPHENKSLGQKLKDGLNPHSSA